MHAQVRQIRISGWKAGLAVLLVVTLGVVAAVAGAFLLLGGAVVALLAGLWLRFRVWLARRAGRGTDEPWVATVESVPGEVGQEVTVREIQVDEVVVRDVSSRS